MFKEAENYYKYVLDVAQKISIPNNLVLALARLQILYSITNQSAKYKEVVAMLRSIGDSSSNPIIKREMYMVLGGYYREINNYDSFIYFRLKHIELFKKTIDKNSASDKLNLGFAYTNLGNMFNELAQYPKALEYLYEGAAYIGDKALTGNEETLYMYFMDAFAGLKKTDSLLKYYRLINNKMAKRDTLYNVLSTANYLLGKYYKEADKKENAYYFASLAYKYGKKTDEIDVQVNSNTLYADLLYQHGDFSKALSILRDNLKTDFEFDKLALANTYLTMSNCFEGLKQWDSAYTYFKKYSTGSESLLQEAANKNIADAEAVYQNRQKNLLISTKNIELKNAAKQKLYLFIALSLVLLIALLLFFIYRNKRNTAKILDEKNKTLATLNSDLHQANQTKAKLFSIIGHDLRSPINQVHQFLKLQQLNPNALSEQDKAKLNQKIQTATGSLLETMEDLLLWSKTQMNEFAAKPQTFNLYETLLPVQHLAQLNIDAHNIQLQNQIPQNILVNTDVQFLQTIYRNLLQNAIKATPQGGQIMVSAQQNEQTLLTIFNTGEAFTQQQFEAYLNTEANSQSLHGLGLRLVQELAEKINAKVIFAAKENGTEVTVVLG